MIINKVKNKSSTQAMKWDKMCIQDIPWNSTIIVAYWSKMLMFGGYQNIMIFLWKANQSGPWQITGLHMSSRGGSCTSGFSWGSATQFLSSGFSRGRPTWGHEPKVFPNLRRTPEYGNLDIHKQLSFYGNMRTFKIGGSPPGIML